ncbi:hypothetical protein QTP86_007376 [Hemibagrus guttatus]|nr:hypothetical protein QTP86_007376 [Hemibagrus guttatus]
MRRLWYLGYELRRTFKFKGLCYALSNTNFIPDRSRPGLTTTAIGAVDLQGAGGNWATVGRRSRGGRRVRRQREKRKGKSVGLRIGTLNVGTMTGKGRELADVMERRKVDILCVQETRWKGSKARSIGAGFKLFYYGVDSKRNGVGVVLKEEFVRNVLEVKRVSDRVMILKLEFEGVMLNVVSGYAPQVGCELEEKERFWSELDEVMESIPTGERVVIGADFNGHVGERNTGDEEVMGKFGVKERNLEGQMVVDFAKRMDMGVVNTYFQKREEHRVTYKSGGRRTQVVLPDDWENTAEVIRETGRKVLGVSSGRRKEDKETWWWNEKVQDSIQRKRLAKKKWDMDRTEENRQEYKELQRRVKREVSKAKQKAYEELYTRLDTREGEKDLYRLARQRDRDGKDVQQKVDKIRKDEVRKALKRMKSGKAVGPDDIPVEVWKCLGEAAVEFLANLFNRVLENLEKAYDRVPREELWYCMRKSGVAEKFVRVVQDMYERSRTVVRCAVVMDQLSEEVRQESPWTMMFADDIVICSESREQVEENLERWRFALERRGMKSNGECGKEKISARIKGKVYRTVVRPAMLYGLETVSLRKRQESELERRDSEYIGRRMLDMELPGRRQRGRPKRRRLYPFGIIMASKFEISETEVNEMSSVLQSCMATDVVAQVEGMLTQMKSVTLNIAVTGESGAGKSSFINAFLGISDEEPGAAQTGVTETTQKALVYSHPTSSNVLLWDLPGIGTPSFHPRTYLEDVGLLKYDFFIIVISDRFQEYHFALARCIMQAQKKFYFIRNKVDRDLEANARRRSQRGLSDDDVLNLLRADCEKNLRNGQVEQPRVFLLSCFHPRCYDFPALQKLQSEVTSTFGKGLSEHAVEDLLSHVATGHQLLANHLEKKVPILGFVIAGGISFVASYVLLKSALKDLSEDGERVIQKSLFDSKHFSLNGSNEIL